jgi:hypothetical protein
MPPKGKADLAHPQAADWVMGTLGPAQADDFQRHLTGCPHCQAAVAEFGQLGQMLQHLPPAAEPPPGLEARTITSVLVAAIAQRAAVATEDRTPTQVHQIPDGLPAAAEDQTATEIHHVRKVSPAAADTSSPTQLVEILPAPPEAGTDERSGGGMAKVIRFPRWHGSARLPAIAGAVAAAIIVAAAIVIPGLGGGPVVMIPLHATTAAKVTGDGAATARATARQVGESWTFDLGVHGLKPLPGDRVYECWWVGPGSTRRHPMLVSGGTFVVDSSGSATVTMTIGVDPRQFRTMEITAESPGSGALHEPILLTGRTL